MKEADEIRISKLTVSREGMLSHCISQGKPNDVFLKSNIRSIVNIVYQ